MRDHVDFHLGTHTKRVGNTRKKITDILPDPPADPDSDPLPTMDNLTFAYTRKYSDDYNLEVIHMVVQDFLETSKRSGWGYNEDDHYDALKEMMDTYFHRLVEKYKLVADPPAEAVAEEARGQNATRTRKTRVSPSLFDRGNR